MNGLPYYKAYPRDFIEGTIGMPFELKAAYRLVLDLIYMQGGELPDDPRYISGLLGCSVRAWNRHRFALIEGGKIHSENGIISNLRADKELESLRKVQVKQAENASGPNKNNDLEKPRLNHTEPDTDKIKDIPKGISKKPASKGTRLPDDWVLPSQWGQWAVGEGWEPDQIRTEADKFRDYWISVSGQKGVKRDWLATWRNWMRNSNTPKGRPNEATNDRNRSAKAGTSHENLFAGFAIAGQRGTPPDGGEADEASGQGVDFGQGGDTSGELLRFPASGEYPSGDC